MINNDTLKLINLLKNYNLKFKCKDILKNIFFMKLYDEINIIIKKNNMDEIKVEELNEPSEHYFKKNNFTSDNVMNEILFKLKYGYRISNENNSIIYFTSKRKVFKKIPNVLRHMLIIIRMLKLLFKRKNAQTVIYFETFSKKKFPNKKNKVLGPDEVNSGLTFLDLHKNGDIILYRKEEILKVLIHELIHSNLIDEKIVFHPSLKNFSDYFCVNYRILLNEAFTESFATIINIFYIHINCKFDKEYLNMMFKNEMKYSLYISLKIINYYNIDKISDVIRNNNSCKIEFPQNTNVFAYYILKNILLTNHIEFANIISKNSKDYKIINENGIYSIIDLIKKKINILDNYKSISDKNNSLRLCLYELFF